MHRLTRYSFVYYLSYYTPYTRVSVWCARGESNSQNLVSKTNTYTVPSPAHGGNGETRTPNTHRMKVLHYHCATLPILVVPTRIELVMVDYQSTVIPFNYRTMVVPVRIELTSMALQATAMTTSAKAPKWLRWRESNPH
jgi:hypothetical protein